MQNDPIFLGSIIRTNLLCQCPKCRPILLRPFLNYPDKLVRSVGSCLKSKWPCKNVKFFKIQRDHGMVAGHGWVPMVEILWFRKSPHMYHKVSHKTILTMFCFILWHDIVIVIQFAFLQVLHNLLRRERRRILMGCAWNVKKPDNVIFSWSQGRVKNIQASPIWALDFHSVHFDWSECHSK